MAQGDSLDSDDWQYWSGTQWVSDEAGAATVDTGYELTGVTTQQGEGGYEAVSIPGSVYTDKSVDVSYACSPTGPWSAPMPVYTIPQVSQYPNEIAYIPTFHTELSGPGNLIVSYNVDTTPGWLQWSRTSMNINRSLSSSPPASDLRGPAGAAAVPFVHPELRHGRMRGHHGRKADQL